MSAPSVASESGNSESLSRPLARKVVGVVASAHGLKALQGFFAIVAGKSEVAYIIIADDVIDSDEVATLLSSSRGIQVYRAEDGTMLEIGCAYILPWGQNALVVDSRLHLNPIEKPPRPHGPIDRFLIGLAESLGANAAGVILSGNGNDGAEGLAWIKAAGGLALVQDPRDSEAPEKPYSALAAGAGGVVLPAVALAEHLVTGDWVKKKTAPLESAGRPRSAGSTSSLPIPAGRLHEVAVERFAPPSVLVNGDKEIVHYSQQAGRYFFQPGGEPSHNLFHRIRPELRDELRATWDSCAPGQSGRRSNTVPIEIDGRQVAVQMIIHPQPRGELQDYTLIFFEEPEEHTGSDARFSQAQARIRELEDQLGQCQQKLSAATAAFEERVTERTQQVRELSSRLTLAEQRERDRIAQILHDDLQQMLVSVQMRVHLLAKAQNLPSESVHDLLTDLENTVEMSRELTMDLSPPVLSHDGFLETLCWLQSIMKQRHQLEVQLTAPDDCPPLRRELRVLLFQVVRELLFNVVKHAQTDTAHVILYHDENSVEIEVRDEGRGFDAHQLPPSKSKASYGTAHIQEQLEVLGGQLTIFSEPNKGCRALVKVPITENVRDDS